MEQKRTILKSSTEEQDLLRPIALWAVRYVEMALPIFENQYPNDERPREALRAAQAFGNGKKRDNNLRKVALATLKSAKNASETSKYVVQAATLAASVAYTHTDLQTGIQGIRQAKHILGPIVYAARAIELNSTDQMMAADAIITRAVREAPEEARYILKHMPVQPAGQDRVSTLFFDLDAALRR